MRRGSYRMFCERRHKYEGEHILQKWTTGAIWVHNKANIHVINGKGCNKVFSRLWKWWLFCCQNQWFVVLLVFFLVASIHIEASLCITPEALWERTECFIIQFRFLYWHIFLLEWVVKLKVATMPLCVLRDPSSSPILEIWLCALVMP